MSYIEVGSNVKVMTQLAVNGQCRQAFEFYEKVLGGKITVMNTFGDVDAKLPPGSTASAPDQIRFAELQHRHAGRRHREGSRTRRGRQERRNPGREGQTGKGSPMRAFARRSTVPSSEATT